MMTIENLENNYLSLNYWARKVVLPTSLALLVLLGLVQFLAKDKLDQDHMAAILGFFTFYFVLIRGGHLFMIRSMHLQLKKDYAGIYPKKLARLPDNMSRRNLGFELARIKAELIHKT